MSVREYFSLRYSIPGYTFILLVVVINYIPLLNILSKMEGVSGVFGAFLAFLSLVSGSALGFLISQFHYLRFRQKGGLFEISEFKGMNEFLEKTLEKYGLDKEKLDKEDEREKSQILWNIADFIRHSRKKEDSIIDYTGRRWDMYHTLSSTLWTLGIGFLTGIIFRIYFQIFVFRNNFSIPNINVFVSALAEVLALIALSVFVLVLSIVIFEGTRLLMKEYRTLLEALYRYELAHDSGKYLREAFPEYFPDNNGSF